MNNRIAFLVVAALGIAFTLVKPAQAQVGAGVTYTWNTPSQASPTIPKNTQFTLDVDVFGLPAGQSITSIQFVIKDSNGNTKQTINSGIISTGQANGATGISAQGSARAAGTYDIIFRYWVNGANMNTQPSADSDTFSGVTAQ